MSVNRVWFPNAPSGSIDVLQRTQIGIGYPLALVPPVDPTVTYYRRYLNDPSSTITVGTPVSFSTSPSTDFTNYMRRYLNNPL